MSTVPGVFAAALIALALPFVAGQQALVERSPTPSNRVVLYVHGAGETAADSLYRRNTVLLTRRLLKDGYSVATSDAHGDNWGTERSVRDYANLVRWLRSRGLTRVYVLAQSMGGMDAMQLIDRVRPVAWAGIFPVCNLAAEARDSRLVPSIQTAHPWGLPSHLSPVRPSRVRGLRMMFWASYADTTVPRASNTDVCASYARSRGADVRVITTRGEHGDPSNYQPGRLAAFFG